MPLLNTAGALFVGASAVSRVYHGSSLVFETGGAPTEGTVVAFGTGETSVESTSHVVTLPGGILSGDRVVVFFTQHEAPADEPGTGSSGWAPVGSARDGTTTNLRGSVFFCASSASGGSPLTITTLAVQKATWHVYVIRGGSGSPVVQIINKSASGNVATFTAITGQPSGDYINLVYVGVDYNTASFSPSWSGPYQTNAQVTNPTVSNSASTMSSYDYLTGVTGVSPTGVTYQDAGQEQAIAGNILLPR